MCRMGAMVVKARMLSFQEVRKQSRIPPTSATVLRMSADSCQLMGSDMAATSLVRREVSWRGGSDRMWKRIEGWAIVQGRSRQDDDFVRVLGKEVVRGGSGERRMGKGEGRS